MAEVIWAEPALADLDAVADYIALDDPAAARRFVEEVFRRAEHLESHPRAGKKPAETVAKRYRELVIPPCRIFYRVEANTVWIVHVMRGERLLRRTDLDR